MKTVLARFAAEFEDVARPLLQPMAGAADVLAGVSPERPVRAALPQLRDLHHRFCVLTDKVAEQQAYVLIFGPLKSGKSTLMNAISAAYVSEVTTLPAYPCMVFVRHAPERSYEITRYDGSKEVLADVEAMRTLMETAHVELATAIREVEAKGQSFDPALHRPESIRRVDVRVPAPDLAESSAVLVDTPGLYTRMKFGYDRMTRDFRDAAACAIFVVKTDNLFLEQVFDEFGELLELFSRIFLLVNIDSAKRDLQPDGQLVTSLEGSDPDRIIAAFENLAMGAPLKAAREEGRLSIYPVDLLRAASGRLSAAAGREDADQPALFPPGDGADAGAPNDKCAAFLGDLTDYLNSTDYLVAFLRDSLRQAGRLLEELNQLCSMRTVASLGEQVDELKASKELCAAVRAALERLSAFAWKSSFEQLEDDLRSIVTGRLANRREETTQAVSAAIDAWYESDGSFLGLHDDHIGPVLSELRNDLTLTAHGVLDTVAGNETAGAQLPAAIRADMGTVRLELASMGKAAVSAVDEVAAEGRASLAVTTAAVPVRKGLADWLLLRRRSTVRRRLFGPLEAPDREVPAAVKAKRIREAGREELRSSCIDELNRFFDEELQRLADRMLDVYAATLRRSIDEALRSLANENDTRATRVEIELNELREVLATMEILQSVAASRQAPLQTLLSRYGGEAGATEAIERAVLEDEEAEVVEAQEAAEGAEAQTAD